MPQVDEYSSRQSFGVIANGRRDGGIVSDEWLTASSQGAVESAEGSNIKNAQQLSETRNRLVNALAQFPVTALWLLNEHEQNCNKSRRGDSVVDSSEKLSDQLADIKKCLLSAGMVLNAKESGSPCQDSKQQLKAELTRFPYDFEDLIRLVDLVVFAYKYRGFCYQPFGNTANNDAKVMTRRLEGMGRRTRINAAKFAELIKTAGSLHHDEQFLFLTAAEMQGCFSEVVEAEHAWLNSRQQLTAANSRLVMFIANQYRGSFLSFDDLVQEGQIGLIKAVDRFDHRLGFQFSTYAGYWIRQAISRALSRSERVVRVPCAQVANIGKVYRTKEELFLKTGVEVSVKELAAHTGFSEEDIHGILSISQPPLSLESFDDDEENSFSPIDFLEQQVFAQPLGEIAEAELEALIMKALKTLNSREVEIICCHFGVDCDKEMTLQDIGSKLNLTRERIRQIQVKALNKLKQNYGQQLISFL